MFFLDVHLPLPRLFQVSRISLAEAGPLLTARSSPALPLLGVPSFYWGTNVV